MRPQRPPAILVLAILHLVFGSLSMLLGLCGGAMQVAGGQRAFAARTGGAPGPNQTNIAEEMEKFLKAKVPHAQTVQNGMTGLDLLLSVLLLVCGVGLLRMHGWARNLSIVYALLSILSKIAAIVYAVTVTVPPTQEFLATYVPQNPQEASMLPVMRAVLTFSAFLPLLWMLYPVVVLIVLFHPSIRAAFRVQEVLPVEDANFSDAEEGRQQEDGMPGL